MNIIKKIIAILTLGVFLGMASASLVEASPHHHRHPHKGRPSCHQTHKRDHHHHHRHPRGHHKGRHHHHHHDRDRAGDFIVGVLVGAVLTR